MWTAFVYFPEHVKVPHFVISLNKLPDHEYVSAKTGKSRFFLFL